MLYAHTCVYPHRLSSDIQIPESTKLNISSYICMYVHADTRQVFIRIPVNNAMQPIIFMTRRDGECRLMAW